jgi:hypothetical protein
MHLLSNPDWFMVLFFLVVRLLYYKFSLLVLQESGLSFLIGAQKMFFLSPLCFISCKKIYIFYSILSTYIYCRPFPEKFTCYRFYSTSGGFLRYNTTGKHLWHGRCLRIMQCQTPLHFLVEGSTGCLPDARYARCRGRDRNQ